MANEPADSSGESNSERAENRTEETKLLGRRDALKLGAATAAVVTGAGVGSVAAAVEREGVSFDRVLNAVDDLGMDPTGRRAIDGTLRDALTGGTLIEFPAGEYRVTERIVMRDRSGIVGVAGDRSDVRFVPPRGTSMRWINFGNNRGIVLKDFTLDRRDDYDTSIGMGGNIGGEFVLRNVEYDGWTPSGPQMFAANVTDPDGTAVVDGLYRTGPTQFQRYPHSSLDIWSGRGHVGHMVLRNVEIHNGSESGIYTGKGEGTYLIENCYMKNVVHTAIRAGGRDSVVRNCTVVIDTEDWDPRNEKVESTYSPGEPIQLNRAIWAQTADKKFAGPVIEDCDVIVKNTTSTAIAGIYVNFDTGGAVIRNTRIRCDDGNVIPIYAQRPTSEAGEPLAMELEGVSVTGEAWDRAALWFEGRPNSVVRDCCISSPNDNDGIYMDDCDGSVVENTNVNVGGRSTTFRNGRVTTSGLTADGGCPLPSLPASTPSDGTPSTSDPGSGDAADPDSGDSASGGGSGSTGGSTDGGSGGPSTADLPYRLVVESLGGGVTEYTASTSGTMVAGDDAESAVTNDAVTDTVGPVSGVDSYRYEGYVTDFDVTGAEYATVTIETSDGARSARIDPALLAANTLTVKSLGGGVTRYEVTVDGEIARGASGLDDVVDGRTATGRVGPVSGVDAFHYTGDVRDLVVEGAEYAEFAVNGRAVDPASLSADANDPADGTGDGGTDDGETSGPTLPNALTVEGTGSSATYRVTVSEEIAVAPGETEDLAGNVSGPSAEGAVTDDADEYVFSGEITDFSLAGDANVYVNGRAVDPESLSAAVALPNSIVIDGSASEDVSTYTIAVTGDIERAPDLTAPGDAPKSYDSITDRLFDGKVVGVVETGTDGYRFSGEVSRFEIHGSAVVDLGYDES